MTRSCRTVVVGIAVAMSLCGCRTAYYAVWEKLGREKRHLLRSQVEKTRSAQEKASEEFKDALTRVQEIYGFRGGDLEKAYRKLHADYQACESRAATVRQRIDSVESIAADLFNEWEREIEEMGNATFRARSRESLDQTQQRYSRLHLAMTQAGARMEPVLKQLKDYVLFLKHNLNSQAVGTLGKEVDDIQVEVAALIKDIRRSIREAERFLATLD